MREISLCEQYEVSGALIGADPYSGLCLYGEGITQKDVFGAIGAVIGGVVGLAGGNIGSVVGGAIGGLVGQAVGAGTGAAGDAQQGIVWPGPATSVGVNSATGGGSAGGGSGGGAIPGPL
jgi:hypothetical protein